MEADAKWLSWFIRTTGDKRLAGCDWQRRQSGQKGDARQPYFELTARRWNTWAECYLTSKELRQSFGSAMHLAAGKCNRALFHPPKAVPVIFAILQTRWTTVTSACMRQKAKETDAGVSCVPSQRSPDLIFHWHRSQIKSNQSSFKLLSSHHPDVHHATSFPRVFLYSDDAIALSENQHSLMTFLLTS